MIRPDRIPQEWDREDHVTWGYVRHLEAQSRGGPCSFPYRQLLVSMSEEVLVCSQTAFREICICVSSL